MAKKKNGAQAAEPEMAAPTETLAATGTLPEPLTASTATATEPGQQGATTPPAPIPTTSRFEPKKPLAAFKYEASGGGFIETCVWPREIQGENGTVTVYGVQCFRSYCDEREQDESKRWKTTNSVRHQDVPVLIAALLKAYTFVLDYTADANGCPF